MNMHEKYNLSSSIKFVDKLPTHPEQDVLIYVLKDDKNKSIISSEIVYLNQNNRLLLIATYDSYFNTLMYFLKKYRDEKQALPKEIIDKRRSNETMQKLMRFMLIPMNNFEEFKERLLLATKEVPAPWLEEDGYRYGDKLVFVSKREEFGKFINIYNEWIPCIKERNEKYWERAILYDKENKIFELYYKEERTNDDAKRTNWSMEIKFYEEKYLYEYLLNREISAVVQNWKIPGTVYLIN